MGMYSESVKCDLSLRYVYTVAQEFGLPTPRESNHNDHAMHMRLRDVKAWVDAAEETVDVHLFYCARVMYEHALAYLNAVSREAAPMPYGRKRLKFFQRASRKYRFLFL